MTACPMFPEIASGFPPVLARGGPRNSARVEAVAQCPRVAASIGLLIFPVHGQRICAGWRDASSGKIEGISR